MVLLDGYGGGSRITRRGGGALSEGRGMIWVPRYDFAKFSKKFKKLRAHQWRHKVCKKELQEKFHSCARIRMHGVPYSQYFAM